MRRLIRRLHDAQEKATNDVMDHADFDKLGHRTPDGFTVNDTLRMWVHHFWSHHRDLVLARGRLTAEAKRAQVVIFHCSEGGNRGHILSNELNVDIPQ